jgi:hypothetical protein
MEQPARCVRAPVVNHSPQQHMPARFHLKLHNQVMQG